MACINKVIIMGNLTREPELRYTQGGSPVCEMSLALNRKSRGREDVCYVEVVAWGKIGENANRYLGKGSSALVEGYLKFEQWQDQFGNNRSKLKITAENVQFISSPQEPYNRAQNSAYDENRGTPTPPPQQRFTTEDRPDTPPPAPEPKPSDYAEPPAEDDIPF
jgi:single-strand DNA-binding protein